MIKNKKQMYLVIGIFALILFLGGTSYAWFSYRSESRDQELIAGEIYLYLDEGQEEIELSNIFPETATEARARNDNFITFDITGKNTSNKTIYYEIILDHGTDKTSPKTRYNDRDLKFDLVEISGNNETYLLSDVSYDSLVNQRIYVNTIDANTSTEVERHYKLRMWLSEDVIISDTATNATYSTAEYKNKYATIKLVVAGDFEEKTAPKPAYNVIAELSGTKSYIASYDDIINDPNNVGFTTQDQVSTSATKQTVYYYTGDDAVANANVLFAGYCWQIIRTTDNGGVRMIYNGVAVNNKCETTRTATKGINGTDGTSTSLSGATLFGRSYDYDLATGQFTIEDSTGLPTAWSENDTNNNGKKDYEELIGTYTCKSSSTTCTTLYYVGSYANSTNAYTASYTIGDVAHYSQMGTSVYNANYRSPTLVGYMFNKEYDYKSGSKSEEYYTNAVWENGAYTLSSGNSGTAPDATHHYICDTDCTKVRYYYNSTSYYILLENGNTVEDALKEMINYKSNTNDADENINVYNSAIKGYLDNWYKKNLTAYANYLDNETVYCNDRSVRDLGGWNPSGTNLNRDLQFYQYSVNRDLSCVNETDRFSKSNSKAKLDYPIGVLSEPERNLMANNFAKTGQYYWALSPHYFNYGYAYVRYVGATGGTVNRYVYAGYGARGVITLKPGTKLENGTGTYDDPYIVGPLVTRVN